MLTAAVRDLHKCHPGQFQTAVRTPCPELWENNPYLTSLEDDDPDVRIVDCEYPLIHMSNQHPHHFLEAFPHFLNHQLKTKIAPTAYKGDIHIAEQEKCWYSQVREILGRDLPFWIIAAGGKSDFTIKWWDNERYQAVVDHFRDRILFVQIGGSGHMHLPLRGVLDLRGRTNLRQLVRLVYHSEGVLCGVSLPMHLAAAVQTKEGSARTERPCVVVAGGREPPHWEAYPAHQYIHTIGALACCSSGGCWKSRTVALGDGDSKDEPDSLCVDVVGGRIPRCMDLITPMNVIDRIALYFEGGQCNYLTPAQALLARNCLTV